MVYMISRWSWSSFNREGAEDALMMLMLTSSIDLNRIQVNFICSRL
jgi:hypothetical protein